MNDGTTGAGYIPFTPIVSTPMEHEPMNPTDMNEAEMREFFAKVASAVVNASDLAKQVAEINARVASLESLCVTHVQTIEALREQVRETARERDAAFAEAFTVINERDVARDAVAKLDGVVLEQETTIHNLLTRIADLEAAAKGAQQTISDLQHTVYNVREELRNARDVSANLRTECEAKSGLLDHYETQLDQVRKAIA